MESSGRLRSADAKSRQRKKKRVPVEVVRLAMARVRFRSRSIAYDQPAPTGGRAVMSAGTFTPAGGDMGSISGAAGVVVG